MKSFQRTFTALALTTALLLNGFAMAQDLTGQAPVDPQSEVVNLLVGDIFEILPAHDLTDATYTWILTQDRSFIEAGRAQVFRKRIIQPGRYNLYAEISSGDQSTHISRTFILDYKPRTPGNAEAPVTSGSGITLVKSIPVMDPTGRIILQSNTQLIRFDPVSQETRPLVLDTDTSRDGDGDGNSTNDLDSASTFFQTDASPLYLWIASPLTSRNMSLTLVKTDGATVQPLTVMSEQFAQSQGIMNSSVRVTMDNTSGRTYSFNATFDSAPMAPLLYQWSFGDGQQSLLANPVHEYAANGTYDVTLRIRNLNDGQEIASYSDQLAVESAIATPDNPVPDDDDNDNGTTTSGGLSRSMKSILMLGGIFLLSVIAGIAVILILSRLQKRGKKLSDTLESMENAIVKKDEKPADAKSLPPLTITPPPAAAKPATPPPQVAEREKERAIPSPLTQKPPTVEEKNAPAWLKSGLTTPAAQAPAPAPVAQPPKPQTPPPAPAPVQPPVTPKPAPVPTPAPAPVQPPKPATPPASPAAMTATTPPWLQQNQSVPQKPVQPAPTQSAAPAMKAQIPPPPPVQPKPVAPVPPSSPAPVTPPAQTAPVTPAQPQTPSDQPIAIIRAESLEKKPENPQSGTPPQKA
jgi:hypothetical protein